MSVHRLSCAYLRAGCCGSQPAREVQMLLSHATLFNRSSGDPDVFPIQYTILPLGRFWFLQVGHPPTDLQRAKFTSLRHCPEPPLQLEGAGSVMTDSSGQHLVRVCLIWAWNPNTAFTLIMQGAKGLNDFF